MNKLILHVGGDKCGSSSIQGFLTNNPTPISSVSPKPQLRYSCLVQNGIIGPKAIARRAKSSINGYVSSTGVSKLRKMRPVSRASVHRYLASDDSTHILSCEGWLRSLSRPREAQVLFNLLNPTQAEGLIDICAFVRPPVKWINSAWWQWGVWGSGVNFDQWLEGAIRSSSWANFFAKYADHSSIDSVVVKPVHGNVVSQFCDALHLDYSETSDAKSNVSLPREALLLMLRHRNHRPQPHYSKTDFILGRALAEGTGSSSYKSTPFALTPAQVDTVIAQTRECTLRLLDYMSEPDRSLVLNDPSWWDASSYDNRNAVDPFEPGIISTEQALQMASDILELTTKSLDILQSNELVDQLMRPVPKPVESLE